MVDYHTITVACDERKKNQQLLNNLCLKITYSWMNLSMKNTAITLVCRGISIKILDGESSNESQTTMMYDEGTISGRDIICLLCKELLHFQYF